MRQKTSGNWLILVSLAIHGAAVAQSPDPAELARFRQKVRQDMTGIPNYTCLETIERTRREAHTRAFKPVDTVRVEVSLVGGKELFAWPGSRRFDDRDLTAMVSGGAIGSGMFAMFAHSLFVTGNGAWQYVGREDLAGRAAIRYDFHLTAQESGFRITTNGGSEELAAKGSFWFDPVSQDLVRLDVYGDAMPYSLGLEESVFTTDYARMRIGEADALLPKRSELTMTHFAGQASRNVMEFSQCRAYRTESTISFDAPPPSVTEAPKPSTRLVDLPAGLLMAIELDTALDSKSSSVGDTVKARVVHEVRDRGAIVVPQGAAVTGHIRKLNRDSPSAPYAIAIELSEVEWTGARAALDVELVDLDRKSAGMRKLVTYFDGGTNKALLEKAGGKAAVFFIEGARFQIPAGLRMTWRTVAPR